MRYIVTIAGQRHTIAVEEDGHARQAQVDERELTADWRAVGGAALSVAEAEGPRAGHYSLLIGDNSYDIYVRSLPIAADDDANAARTFEVTIGAQT